MSREYTQKELQTLVQIEKELDARGVIMYGDEDAANNGKLITEYFEVNPSIPVTMENAIAASNTIQGLVRKSAAQIAYDQAYENLTKAQQDQFGSWWHRQGKVLVLENDEGFSNAAKIISWMRGKTFDARGLDLAVSNLVGSSGLHLVYQSTFRGGKHSKSGDNSFMKKSETNLSARDHAARPCRQALGVLFPRSQKSSNWHGGGARLSNEHDP